MIELVLFRQIAVIVASLVGGYTDLKTGYIYDWITYPLIAFGVILNLAEQNFFGIGLGLLVFGIGYALYYTGKLGGGDVKLYTGIALALPVFNGATFILTVVILSALSAIVFLSTFYTIKYFRKGVDWKLNKEGIMKAGLLIVAILFYLNFMMANGFVSSYYAMIFGLPVFFGAVFLALEKGIRKEFFLKKIKLKDFEEDEIIAFEFLSEEEREKIGKTLKGVVGESEKKELGKKGIKELLVYRNLPRFGAFIFVGVVLGLVFPEFGVLFSGGF